jgi:hypothetical protein
MLLCNFLLQDMAYELKNEVASQLLSLNVSSFSMAPVKVCRFIHSNVKNSAFLKMHYLYSAVLFIFPDILFIYFVDQLTEEICI